MDRNSDTYARMNRFAVTRKDSLLAIAIVVCCISILVVYFSTRKSRDDISYVNQFSPEYEQNMMYLLNASMERSHQLPKDWFGYFGAHIPIVQEQDLTWFTQRLRQELRHADNKRLLFHRIVVGGMRVRDIDQPMLDAGKGFRMRTRPNVEIIIVAPSTISAETRQVLEKKGLKIHLIGPPSRGCLK
jgi:hypothetical protein